MLVCAHGDVKKYCNDHDMTILETYDDEIENYNGRCRVIVTDKEMSEQEYYFLKEKLLGRGIEMISTRHKDDGVVLKYIMYSTERRRKNGSGRPPYGYRREKGGLVEIPNEIAVIARIRELRRAGHTLREIQRDEEICERNGRIISLGTIQKIIKEGER